MSNRVQDILSRSGREFSDKPALSHSKKILTFAELDEQASTFSLRLQDLGLKDQDRVGILTSAGFEPIVAFFGALKAACIPIFLNSQFKEPDLGRILTETGIKAVVCQDKQAASCTACI